MTDDPRDDWITLTAAATKVKRNPRVVRRWADEGLLTKTINGIRYTKLRYVHQWSADTPRRAARNTSP